MDVKKIYEELKEVEALIEIVKKDIDYAPEGRLRIAGKNGKEQYYHVTKETDIAGKYISKKKNPKLAKELAQKDYAKKFIGYLNKKKDFLERTIEECNKFVDRKIYNNYSELRKKLINPYGKTDEEYVEEWQVEEYERLPISEEQAKIYTEKGELVRSKSEKMIADKLLLMNIPYKYERPLYLKGYGEVYPDFTLLDIKGRNEVMLEHFGMMDNYDYVEKAIKKINAYHNAGYVMGKSFLFTIETYRNPINMKNFEKMINDRFY